MSIDEYMTGYPGEHPNIYNRDTPMVDIEVHQEAHHDPAYTMDGGMDMGEDIEPAFFVSTVWFPEPRTRSSQVVPVLLKRSAVVRCRTTPLQLEMSQSSQG